MLKEEISSAFFSKEKLKTRSNGCTCSCSDVSMPPRFLYPLPWRTDMSESYLRIQKEYLRKAWARPVEELQGCLQAEYRNDCFHFHAFSKPCTLCREEIIVDGETATGPEGILIAMYAAQAVNAPVKLQPVTAFKELPDSTPYHGAFTANAEQPLVPHVEAVQRERERIVAAFSGQMNPDAPSGDFSFTLYPLPLIPLYYIFYLPDEEFPASVTCLFASNAADFMPVAGLADVAEYTGKAMLSLIRGGKS